MTIAPKPPGTRFVVDLGEVALPYEQAKSIEAGIRRLVYLALADLDLVLPSAVPPEATFEPGAPIAARAVARELPPGELYGVLVGPEEWRPIPPIDEHPF